MPEAWPQLAPDEIASLAGLDYADAAYRIMRPFLEGDPCQESAPGGDSDAIHAYLLSLQPVRQPNRAG